MQKAKPRRGLIDILLVIGVIVALAGIGFAVGRLTAPAATGFGQGRGGQFTGNGQFNGQVPGGRPERWQRDGRRTRLPGRRRLGADRQGHRADGRPRDAPARQRTDRHGHRRRLDDLPPADQRHHAPMCSRAIRSSCRSSAARHPVPRPRPATPVARAASAAARRPISRSQRPDTVAQDPGRSRSHGSPGSRRPRTRACLHASDWATPTQRRILRPTVPDRPPDLAAA